MKHAFISPINYLDLIPNEEDSIHLCLPHLIADDSYRSFYQSRQKKGDFIILDNGAFENKVPMRMIDLVDLCKDYQFFPNVLVLPDYPMDNAWYTVEKAFEAIKIAEDVVNWPCQFMAVPQSVAGDYRGWLNSYDVLCNNPRISWIGMSILGIPNAFSALTGTQDVSFNRTFATSMLIQSGKVGKVKHHYLGCSSPREILLMAQQGVAYSNDSSTAIWHGHLGIAYDDSVSGLIDGKTKHEVDFFCSRATDNLSIIKHNVAYIQQMILPLGHN